MSMVWEHSRQEGGALLVLLAIADFADDAGVAYPSVGVLARKARLGVRQTQAAIQRLRLSGELAVTYNQGPRRRNVYQVVLGKRVLGGTPAETAPPGQADREGAAERTPARIAPCSLVHPL